MANKIKIIGAASVQCPDCGTIFPITLEEIYKHDKKITCPACKFTAHGNTKDTEDKYGHKGHLHCDEDCEMSVEFHKVDITDKDNIEFVDTADF